MAESVGQREERYRTDNIYWSARYEAAYAQIGIRIVARENILIGYIAAAATLIGVAFGSPELRKLVLVIPYMAAAVALILSNHENVIRRLEGYLADLSEDIPDDWFNRRKITRERAWGLVQRTFALYLIIGTSSIVAILIGREIVGSNVWVWYGSILYAVLAIFWAIKPRVLRMRQYLEWTRRN